MAFASTGTEINCHLGMVHTVSRDTSRFDTWLIYANEANKPGYGQLFLFNPVEATTKWLEGQSNQKCMAKVMQQVSPLGESYRQMHQMEYINE